MAVYKEEKTNTWRAVYRYTDWNGERKQTQKRGFKTKREAQAWEREQLNKSTADLDMTFRSFVELYTADMQTRLKENTWATKDHIIRTKLLPYFGKLKMCNIRTFDESFAALEWLMDKSYTEWNGDSKVFIVVDNAFSWENRDTLSYLDRRYMVASNNDYCVFAFDNDAQLAQIVERGKHRQ